MRRGETEQSFTIVMWRYRKPLSKWQHSCYWKLSCQKFPQNCVTLVTRLHIRVAAWWRHQMETFSALLAICAGNSPDPAISPHKDQWRGALMFSLTCTWINGRVNNREAADLRLHRAHYDVIVMSLMNKQSWSMMLLRLTKPASKVGMCK